MKSACFDTLPHELKLDIAELLYDLSEHKVPRVMAQDAAWAKPYYHFEINDETRHYQRVQYRPESTLDSPFEVLQSEEEWPSPLKALRLVSRQYHQISTPLLYRELDLDIIHRHTYEDLKTLLRLIVTPHGKHVRSVRIHVGRGQDGLYLDEWSFITGIMAVILSKCPNATTIAVYYRDGKEYNFGEFANQIVQMIASGQVVAFGLFSTDIMRRTQGSSIGRALRSTDAPMQMLNQLLRVPGACRSLRRLDLVMEDIDQDLFDLIRSRCTYLRSLTIRRGLRHRLPGIFSDQQLWAPNDNLTRLSLMSCNSAYAPHMPLLVQHFRGLKELIWATCGHHHDTILQSPVDGWSKDPAFQPLLRRKPLLCLIMEHIVTWEIDVLSVIPAEDVTVANLEERSLVNSMIRRVTMFPGMKILRVLPQTPVTQENEAFRVVSQNLPAIGAMLPTLDSLCQDSGVTLIREARLLHPCTCCRA